MAYSKQTWDTTSYVNPTRMNHIEDGIESASTATGTEYSSGVSVKEAIDSKANSTRLVTAVLTYNSSTTRFELPANTPLPPDRLSLVVRNYNTGSYVSHDIYVLTFFSTSFVITKILEGGAPSNGHTAVAQWFSNS